MENPFVGVFGFLDAHGHGGGVPVGNHVRPFDEGDVAFRIENLFSADVYERFVVFDAVEVEMVEILTVFLVVDVGGAFDVFRDAPDLGDGFYEGRLAGSEVSVEERQIAREKFHEGGEVDEGGGLGGLHVSNIRTPHPIVNPGFCVRAGNVVA